MFLSDRRPWLGFLSRVGWCFAGGEGKMRGRPGARLCVLVVSPLRDGK